MEVDSNHKLEAFKLETWGQAEKTFFAAFGKDRVSKDKEGVKIRFNLQDTNQARQFHRLGEIALRQRIIFPCNSQDESDAIMSVSSATNPVALKHIVDEMHIRRIRTAEGEIHRPIVADQPEHVLEELTDHPWDFVENSRYGGTVVEPRQTGVVDPGIRRSQEFGMATVLRPEGVTLADAQEWIDHQQMVEGDGNPHTALPGDWVRTAGLDRANVAKGSSTVRNALRSVFSKTR
jgi:hypothetical protein